jgi:hypothetical protein
MMHFSKVGSDDLNFSRAALTCDANVVMDNVDDDGDGVAVNLL